MARSSTMTRPHASRRLVRAAGAILTAAVMIAGVGVVQGATRAHAADPAVPPWLVPLHFTRDGGAERYCTGIVIARYRVLTPAGCYTGRTARDFEWFPDGGGAGNPVYRTHPQYSATTGLADLGVWTHGDDRLGRSGPPTLAGAADSKLYRPGAGASFYSWPRLDMDGAPRFRHAESVMVRSAADCAALLGRPLVAGTFCTSPAPGAPPVADQDLCLGDAGGALVAGGKLVGMSATPSQGCATSVVRVYTRVDSYQSLIRGWARDIDLDFLDPGSVLAREPAWLVDICTMGSDGRLWGCAVDSSGVMWEQGSYSLLLQAGDLDGNGHGDMIARHRNGTLHRIPDPMRANSIEEAPQYKLSKGWNRFNLILAPRDLSGDGYPDLLARDAAGVMLLYPGNGTGRLGRAQSLGRGWNAYTAIASRGDLSGDGRTDVIARDRAGVLWVFRGNGRGGLQPRRRAGTGWNIYNAIVGSGDMDRNGQQDFVARTPAGALYLYNATGRGGFAPRKRLAARGLAKYRQIT